MPDIIDWPNDFVPVDLHHPLRLTVATALGLIDNMLGPWHPLADEAKTRARLETVRAELAEGLAR